MLTLIILYPYALKYIDNVTKIAQNYSKQNIAVETEMLTFTQGARYYNYFVKPLIDII